MFGGSYKARIEQIERDLDRLMNEVHKLSTALSTNSNTALLVRFNELEAALEALQKSNRREFGKLWRVGVGMGTKASDADDELDPELVAQLELQRAGNRSA